MDFDLSADQVALRDGIRSLCEGRFPIKRVRDGFDRGAYAELAEAGVFSLRADGFGVADAAVVFEELGRAVVPGPLVWLYLANGLVDGVVGGLEVARRRPPWMVEHLDVLDTLLVVDDDGVQSVAAGKVAGALPVGRPLDPLTPVHRVEQLPAGEPVGDADVVPTLAARGRGADGGVPRRLRGRVHRALGRVRQGAPAVRPAHRLVPGGQAPARRHARARRGGARVGARGGVHARRPGRRGRRPRRRRRQGAGGRGGDHERQDAPPRSTAAWASPGRSTCTST